MDAKSLSVKMHPSIGNVYIKTFQTTAGKYDGCYTQWRLKKGMSVWHSKYIECSMSLTIFKKNQISFFVA